MKKQKYRVFDNKLTHVESHIKDYLADGWRIFSLQVSGSEVHVVFEKD